MKTNELNAWFDETAISHLGIKITEISTDHIVGLMPVDNRHIQSMGLLHGGVSCVLAETLGSALSNLVARKDGKISLGQEINASHLKGVAKGEMVIGRARFLKKGRSVHVTEITIHNDANDLVCISRLTTIVRPKPI